MRLPPAAGRKVGDPECHTIVGRVCASLADGTNVELDALCYVSLPMTMDISNLKALMEGVGGSFKSLAALAVRHLDLQNDTPITELCLEILRNVLIFAARVAEAADDGDGPPNSARTLIEDLVLVGCMEFSRPQFTSGSLQTFSSVHINTPPPPKASREPGVHTASSLPEHSVRRSPCNNQ
ncbi:hypothetical protein B0H14DRAFT_3775549 [Mycena olivaceomarginata]|nr:hypothetical protein B0H14DRAFT_3775549 [Mycena olivaceomarginata]